MESTKKALDVCPDEIDRSKPPMVVLLGYRCDRIPDDTGSIKTTADRKQLELEELEKSTTIKEQLAAELGTDKSKSALAISYEYIAEIYEKLGGSDNLKRAQGLYIKSLTIKELLDNGWKGPESKLDCFTRSFYKGGGYMKLFDGNTLELAPELYHKAEELLSDC